jgi:hypothetical protein
LDYKYKIIFKFKRNWDKFIDGCIRLIDGVVS